MCMTVPLKFVNLLPPIHTSVVNTELRQILSEVTITVVALMLRLINCYPLYEYFLRVPKKFLNIYIIFANRNYNVNAYSYFFSIS